MNRLGVAAIINAVAGVIVILGAWAARTQVATPLLGLPDYTAVNIWTGVGFGLLGIAAVAGLLSMLVAEFRAMIRNE